MTAYKERQLTGEPKPCSAFVSENTMRGKNLEALTGVYGKLFKIGLAVLFAVFLVANPAYAQGVGPVFTELAASSSNPTSGTPLTLSALVDTGGGAPTGTVSFYDCGKLLGSGPVTVNSSNSITNYILTSDNMAANWTPSGTATISASTVAAPFGISSVSMLSGNPSDLVSQTISNLPAGSNAPVQLTVSVWLQAPTGSAPVIIELTDAKGFIHSAVVTPNAAWERYSATFSAWTGGPVTLSISEPSAANGGESFSVLVWGIQLETAAAAGPYMSTSSGETSGVGGIASLTLSSLAPGAHGVTAFYTGNYNDSTSSAVWVWVFQGPSIALSSSANPSLLGRAVTFTATVTGGQAGESIIFVDSTGDLGAGTLNTNGVASLTVPALSLGTHEIFAAYGGDSLALTSMSGALPQVVQTNDSLTLQASASTVAYGGSVTLTATASSSSSLGAMTGTIEFFEGGAEIGSPMTLGSGGTVSLLTPSLSPGVRSFTAQYSGDSNYTAQNSASVTVAVNGLPTSVSLTSATPTPPSGSPITYTATVTPAGAAGMVELLSAQGLLGSAMISNGIATLSAALSGVGNPRQIYAFYYGNATYASSTSNTLTETPVAGGSVGLVFTTPVSGQTVVVNEQTMLAAVSLGTMAASGTIQFALDGKSQGSAQQVSDGGASISLPSSFSSTAVGSHTLTANYSGDSTFAPASSSVTFQLVNETPIVAVGVSAGSILRNQALWVGTQVSAPGYNLPCTSPGGGSITVLANGSALGSFPVPQQQLFQIPAGTLSPGNQTITAQYSGYGVCNPASASTTVTVTDYATVATPVWLFNPSNPMGPYTAQLFGESPAPTGNMTLNDGTTGLATATVGNVTAQNLVWPVVLMNWICNGEADNCGAPTPLNGGGVATGFDPTVAAPDGSNSALSLLIQGYGEQSGVYFGAGGTCTPGETYQFSIFARGAGQQIMILAGFVGRTSLTSNWFTTSANWQQYTFQAIAPAGTVGCSIEVDTSSSAPPSSVDIWGPQIQEGTSVGPYSYGYYSGTDQHSVRAASIPATLSTGPYSLTAAYSGDGKYLPGTSELLSETVTGTQPSSVILSLSPNPSRATLGETIMLNAQVMPSTATGTVSFNEAPGQLGTMTINSSGAASFPVEPWQLMVGANYFSVSYSGDNTYLGSTSVIHEIIVVSPPVVTTASPLPNAYVGQYYDHCVAASGGLAPYTWSASGLPGGLTLSTMGFEGCVRGTPTANGATIFTVQVTDHNRVASASTPITLNVCQPVTTTLTAVPNPATQAGNPIVLTATFSAPVTGNATFYSNGTALGTSPINSGNEQAVFRVNNTAGLTIGTLTFTAACVGDSNYGCLRAGSLVETVNPAPVVATTSLPGGAAGQPYTTTLAATQGVAPYRWWGEKLPNWLSISSGGTITATNLPAGVGGVYEFLIGVTDNNNAMGSRYLSIQVVGSTGVTLACTPGAIVYGNIATCAAGVSAGATGTIALNDAYTSPQGGAVSTVLSTQTVAGGQTALFTLPPLPVAAIVSGVQSAHAITALYTSNNGNNNSAISSPAYVTVNPAAPTLTVACPGGAYSGTAYSCTGSATGIGGATVTGSFGFVYTGVSGTTYGPSTTAPTNGGTYSVVGTFTSTDSNYASGGTVSATLTIYSLTITPASLLLTFNPQKVGTSSVAQYIELFNHGTTSTVVSGATLTGAGFVMSNQAGTCTTGETLQPGTHCVIRIIFTPAGGGPATGTVVIGSVGAPGGSYTVTLTGTGEAPVTASVTATNKTYDDTYTEPVGNVTCALTAGGSNVTCAATAASFASANVGTGITVTATGITLSGSASAYYYLSSTSATTTANINPAAPTLSVSCPAVTFNAQAQNTCTGTATGVGGASVSGSFSFAPGNETNAGTYTETGTFTSTDPHNNYVSGGTASASFTINPATPALSVNCPAVSFNGQAQMPCTGTATGVGGASVSGSFSFAPGSETNAGTYTETGTFASTNSNYASGGTASGSFTIYPVLSITTASLPNGILGAAYSASLTASGGMGSYTWSIPSGQPGWLTLNGATGAITGTPSAAGSYTLTVQVRDSNTPADVATTSLTIVVGSGPAITGLSVTSGYVGLNITITGLRFGATQGTSTVTFNGVLATAIVSWSNTAIKAAIPAGAQNGNVVVKVAGQASNGVPFFLEPWITGISIGQGPIGMGVVISGYNFGAVQGTSTVTFNGLQAAVAAEAVSPTDPTAPPAPGWNDTQITAQVPEGATTGGIIVTTLFGASNSMQFTVDSPFGCGQ